MRRSSREREARYLHFNIQRPGDLIYISHLAHAILTLDTGPRKTVTRWDAAITSNQKNFISTLKLWIGILSVCILISDSKFFLQKVSSALWDWAIFFETAPQKSGGKLQKHCKYSEQLSPNLLNTLSIEGPGTNRKVYRRPSLETMDFPSTHSS